MRIEKPNDRDGNCWEQPRYRLDDRNNMLTQSDAEDAVKLKIKMIWG